MLKPLTSMQAEIYFDQSRHPGHPIYNVGVILDIHVPIDHGTLQQAINLLVSRVGILSMKLVIAENGECMQDMNVDKEVTVDFYDFTDVLNAKDRALSDVTEFYQRPFDLMQDELFVVKHYRFSEDKHWIVLKCHHIMADGFAVANVCRLLGPAYKEIATGEANESFDNVTDFSSEITRHKDYLSSKKYQKDSDYWEAKLRQLPSLLFGDYRPKSLSSSHLRTNLEPETVTAIRKLTQHTKTSIQHIGLAALTIYFTNVYNRNDTLFAVPIHRRKTYHQKNMLGTMASDIPCHITTHDELTLTGLLKQISTDLRASYRHTDFPLAHLLRDGDILAEERESLCDVVYNYEYRGENYLFEGEELIALYLFSGTEQAALHVRLIDFGEVQPLGIYISAHNDLMSEQEIEIFSDRINYILQQLTVENSEKIVSSFDPLPEKEKAILLKKFSGPDRCYAKEESLNVCFERQAALSDESMAVNDQNQTLSYSELNHWANLIAHRLLEKKVAKGDVVAIYAERSVEFLAAMIGIWKAGAVYVPLDPKNPTDRTGYMLDDAQPRIILCDASTHAQLQEKYQERALLLSDCLLISTHGNESLAILNPCNINKPEDLAYLIYTSGSTGKPKGSLIHHGGALHHINALFDELGLLTDNIRSPLTVLQSASSSSDISMWQLIAPVISGGKTVIFENMSDMPALITTIQNQQIELVECVPVVIRLLLDYVDSLPDSGELLPSLQWMMTTGDAITAALVNDWFDVFNSIPLINAYGPSETSDDVTLHQISKPMHSSDATVSIGRPMANTSIHIVDADDKLLPIGVAGELCISGDCVGQGYWNNPAKTAEKFIPNPYAGFSGVHGDTLYRSGDLAKWSHDGLLHFIGRADNQVQVRGYRVELGEVESCLAAYPAVGDVAVILEKDAGLDARLFAFVTEKANTSLGLNDLQQFANEKLPPHMMPSIFHVLEKMPRNAADKIDRQSLQTIDLLQNTDVDNTCVQAVNDEMEKYLVDIWADILGANAHSISRQANFFSSGGHSLSAVRLVAAIRSRFEIDIDIRHIFATPVLSELAEFIKSRQSKTVNKIEPAPANARLPLSYAQQRIWFIDQFEPGGSEYNASVSMRLHGQLDLSALNQAFNNLLDRHSVLRSHYISENGNEYQVINEVPANVIEVVGADTSIDYNDNLAVNHLVKKYTEAPFDLSQGAMVRCVVIKVSDVDSILVMTVHHIASDGWSQGIMMKELARLYAHYASPEAEEKPALPALPIQYKDYAYWQRNTLIGQELEEHLSYWRHQLNNLPAVHNLPLDKSRPAKQSHVGGLLTTLIPNTDLGAMRGLLAEKEITLFMLLMGVFTSLLHRYSGDNDVVIGSPVANREQSEIAELVGFFVNTLVYRTRFEDTITFDELLMQCKQNALDGYAHQQMPFELLVDALQPTRSSSYNPLFQIMLTLENNDIGEWVLPGIETEVIEPDSIASQFDLSLDVKEDKEGLVLTWNYACDLFNEATITRLADHFRRLLVGLCTDSSQRINQAGLLEPAEQNKLLVDYNNTSRPEFLSTPWTALFEKQVSKTPEHIAATYLEYSYTYEELEQQSRQQASALYERGIGNGCVVAIIGKRSLRLLVSIIAVLRAGAAYLPLDPNHPMERTQRVLSQTEPSLLLIDDQTTLPLDDIRSVWRSERITMVSELCDDSVELNTELPHPSVDDLAYIISTSGSTGTPKGVMINHKGMINNMLAKIEPLQLSAEDVIAQTASQCFDISVWQFLTALTLGASTDIVPTDITQDPDKLMTHLSTRRINIWEPVPSVIRAVLSNPITLPDIRFVLPTGEALTAELVEQWFVAYPDIPLINAYGPAECSDDVTFEVISTPIDKVWIGQPVANARVHIVDAQQQLVPVGVVGEIAVSGPVVGRGYIHAAELTQQVFIDNPYSQDESDNRLYLTGDLGRRGEHGKIEYLGRKDHQVKIRGLRIELDDIASALRQSDLIKDAAVIAHSFSSEQHQLIAFVVKDIAQTDIDSPMDHTAIRHHLIELLPSYMIPEQTVVLSELPVNSNGKVDKNKLVELIPEVQVEGAQPDTPTQQSLADIWSELLKIDRSTLHLKSDFFALGGHSLLGVRLVTAIEKQFEVVLPVRDIFDHCDLQAMASQIDLLNSQKQVLQRIQALPEAAIEEFEF